MNQYGRKLIPKLCKELGVDERGLYDSAKVAGLWSETEVQELVSRQGPVNMKSVGLTWSHLVCLARASADDRLRLLQQALDNGWSVKRLKAEIAGAGDESGVGDESEAGDEDEADKDEDPLGGLRELEKQSQAQLEDMPSLDKPMADVMSDLPSDAESPQLLEVLRSIKKIQEEIKARCEKNLEEIASAISAIEKNDADKG